MAEEMSKSAKRRAAKKARDAAGAEEPAAPAPAAPAPAPAKAKAAAKSAAGAGYPEPKAKAKAKAEPKAAAAPPAPEPKAKAKGKAKAEPAPPPQAAPPAAAPEPKAGAKAKAKSQPAGKAKAAPKPVEEPESKKVEVVQPYMMDDGTGGDWEVSTGLTAKQQRQKQRKEEEKREMDKMKKQGMVAAGNKHIAGLNFVPDDQKRIPGVSQAVSKAPLDIAAMRAEAERLGKQAGSSVALEEAAPKVESSTATVKVPTDRIGVVIGPKGAKIKVIQEKTEVRIDTSDELFTITGPAKGVALAETAILDLVKKGYTPLLYDGFEENFMQVYVASLPEIIGSKGATIIKIKDELGVEVNMPSKEEQQGKKCRIGMGGPKDKVEKCKEVIESILMYGHHEITHPGETHEELEVEDWAYGPIIGPKGSELRHMQKTFQVKVNIPRDTSLNKNVVVVGMPNNVSRCKAYIERIVSNYLNQTRGRGREDKAEDGWGDEEPEEDWMKAYLYKRK